MALVSFLRAHCPWDRAQTPESLIKHLIEESHEVADAILREDPGGLRGELGDLLLNLAFQLVIAEEEEHFRREDVWEALDDKMRRRHPHLFDLGDAVSWEEAKEREDRRDRGALAGLPATLPPLAKATALGRRAGQVGFDWTDPAGALAKIHEEVDELAALLEPTEASSSVTTAGDRAHGRRRRRGRALRRPAGRGGRGSALRGGQRLSSRGGGRRHRPGSGERQIPPPFRGRGDPGGGAGPSDARNFAGTAGCALGRGQEKGRPTLVGPPSSDCPPPGHPSGGVYLMLREHRAWGGAARTRRDDAGIASLFRGVLTRSSPMHRRANVIRTSDTLH